MMIIVSLIKHIQALNANESNACLLLDSCETVGIKIFFGHHEESPLKLVFLLTLMVYVPVKRG